MCLTLKPAAEIRKENLEKIEKETFKMNHFDGFPTSELYKIIFEIEKLGYSSTIENNGNICFSKSKQ